MKSFILDRGDSRTLQKYGFFIKKISSFEMISKNIINTLLLTPFLFGILSVFGLIQYVLSIYIEKTIPLVNSILFIALLLLIYTLRAKIKLVINSILYEGNILYLQDGVIIEGEYILYSNLATFKSKGVGPSFFTIKNYRIIGKTFLIIIATILFISLGIIYLVILEVIFGSISAVIYAIISAVIIGLFPIISTVGRFIFHVLHPLFRFGNLGEKIQFLTPHISEQSEVIQKEFSSTMDFRVLSKSFDTLASTFSRIVGLVIKLEQVEKKANKGDIFDSTKYINSLREDIRTPLLSLKTFLETKKTELITSQKGLSRVRVNVGGESENRELQSMRSDQLLKELDGNIARLDGMIGKL